MRALANDKSIFIKKKKKIDKGSTVVVWDCHDYMLEAEKHLSDANVYKEVYLKYFKIFCRTLW